MKMLDEQECRRWYVTKGVNAADSRRLRFIAELVQQREIPLPMIGLKVVALAIVLRREILNDSVGNTFLWLSESGMWSEEFERLGARLWAKLLGSGSTTPD